MRRLVLLTLILMMTGVFATTTAGLCCISVNGQTFCSNTDGGGGGGGGGTPVPTPTPNRDQLNQNVGQSGPFTGPVPAEIQTATGLSTWQQIAQLGDQQLQAAAAAGADSITTEFQDGTPVRVTLHVDDATDTPGPTETPTP